MMKKFRLFSIAAALSILIAVMPFTTQAYSKGDANNDGNVNVRDCAYIASSLASGKAYSLPEEADYNSDGNKNVRDAAQLASDLAKGNISDSDHDTTAPFEYDGILPTGGDTFTILSWTGDDLDEMLEKWMKDENISVDKVKFLNLGVGGGEAAKMYEQYLLGGYDIDMFTVEVDWALKYLNDNNATAPLSELGFTESDFADQYEYTINAGKSSDGVLKAVSYFPAPGGWCYRTDLAEKYLGVNSTNEMQKLVSDWDKFQSTAQKVSSLSNGKTAFTSTLGGMWQAYSQSRTSPWVQNNKLVVDDFCDYFINMAKNMKNNGYVTESYQWTDEWYNAGQTDSIMGYFSSTWGFGSSILATAAGGKEGATYGKWNVCQGPTPYFWGGTWLCASPETDNADMVANFINYFTVNPDTMSSYVDLLNAKPYQGYIEFVNNQSVMDKMASEGKCKSGVFGGQNDVAVMNEVAKSIDNEGKITPYDASVKICFMDAVNSYCNGETSTANGCIQDFKNRVAEELNGIETE